ncbi:kinase-like domain-containing protein [Pilobolus umbonatus]|nr:kinase-like domain-containing protein [Pilobolus umbonatus]
MPLDSPPDNQQDQLSEDWSSSTTPSKLDEITCQNLLTRMTIHISDTFKRINPVFDYDSDFNPKRVLTKPGVSMKNDNYDNANSDFILYVHAILGEHYSQRYEVIDILGSGTFGQVVKCRNLETGELVAVKVIKNKPAYTKQGRVEIEILSHLNNVVDPDNKHNLLRLKDSFSYKNHLCLVFELLSANLYDLIKQNHFKGLSMNLIRIFSTQLLNALYLIKQSNIIHCDLKPENILLKDLDLPIIKVIDYGSSCNEAEQTYTYIQSRFYRAPEVIIGHRYTTAIDMWSFGCIVAELFLGLPLFPGNSEYNQLTRIIEAVGDIPDHMILEGKYGYKYYNIEESDDKGLLYYSLKDIQQYSDETNKQEKPSKRYLSTYNLNNLILKYPFLNPSITKAEREKEIRLREMLLDFLKKILVIDPEERLSPEQALNHPFIAGFDMEGSYRKHEELFLLGRHIRNQMKKEQKAYNDTPVDLISLDSDSNTHSKPSTSQSINLNDFSIESHDSLLTPSLSSEIFYNSE